MYTYTYIGNEIIVVSLYYTITVSLYHTEEEFAAMSHYCTRIYTYIGYTVEKCIHTYIGYTGETVMI